MDAGVPDETLVQVKTLGAVKRVSGLAETLVATGGVDALSVSAGIVPTLVCVHTGLAAVLVARVTVTRVGAPGVEAVTGPGSTNVRDLALVNVSAAPSVRGESVARLTAALRPSSLGHKDT